MHVGGCASVCEDMHERMYCVSMSVSHQITHTVCTYLMYEHTKCFGIGQIVCHSPGVQPPIHPPEEDVFQSAALIVQFP